MNVRSILEFTESANIKSSLIEKGSARRGFMLTALAAALAASSAAVRAQTERKASTPVAEGPAGVDPTPATVEDMGTGKRVAGDAQVESFKVTARGKSSTVTVRAASGGSGDAIVTIDGQEVRIRSQSQFDINKPAAASTAKGSNDFWACMIASMIKQIGQAAWNKIKSNYQSMWDSTKGKTFVVRVGLFLKNVFTLPYGSYALNALVACK